MASTAYNSNWQSYLCDDNDWQSKFVLICKPEQSGKTFIMIQQINKYLEEPTDGKTVVNFIFCDNSLLLTKQTSERVKKDVPPSLPQTGESYVEFSSRNDGVAERDAAAVCSRIMFDDIRNIICCTNGKRVFDISTIVEKFNSSPHTRGKFEFKIWLDEADKFVKFINKTFKPLVQNNDNVQIFGLTATPDTLFKKYNYMNVFPLEKTTNPEYHGWEDNNRVIVEDVMGTEAFIHHVLTNVVNVNQKKSSKWYIPANTKKSSHEHVRDLLVGKGFAVFVVNGNGLALTLPTEGHPNFCEDKTEELNKQMLKMYKKNNLERFPVAITGNICVGRGISVMSPEFIFDYAILSNCTKKAEASQNAGRLKGNIKGWEGYKPPTVFTTEKFDSVAAEWEQKSRRLAETAFEKDDTAPSKITKTQFRTMDKSYEYIKHPHLFATMKDVRAFLASVKKEMGLKTNPKPEDYSKHKEQCGGYSVTSKLLRDGKKAKDLTADDRLTTEMADAIGDATCISTNKGNRYLVLPVYDNMDTPPEEEQYQVRYIRLSK